MSTRNRSVTLSETERAHFQARLLRKVPDQPTLPALQDRVICGDAFDWLPHLPDHFADLIIADPPYNLRKRFRDQRVNPQSDEDYEAWLEAWIGQLPRLLSPTGSIYVCSHWQASAPLQRVLSRHFHVRNRITWEREKGRGSLTNWKSTSEDIWYATAGEDYHFAADAVKLRRRVNAPYRDAAETPRGWEETDDGRFRLTHASNFWNDLTVPFWSMPENTEHPTQKPEKLIAKLILASSREGELIFDPFCGVGTTPVVARKLRRHFVGIERDELYACFAEKRLQRALSDPSIQGYRDGVFGERGTR
jgi:site-specific DNA-methyltransferase (adenine-specific)